MKIKKDKNKTKTKIKKNFGIKKILNLRNFIILLLFGISTYVFFQYKMIFLTDSKYYYFLSKCLLGIIPMRFWHPIRGFGYPLLIAICTTVFGDNPRGMLIGAYLVYMAFNILFLVLLNKFLNLNNIKKKNKIIIYILYIDLVIFNTLYIGFTHTVMTESIMPLVYLIGFALCLKWYNLDKNEKIKLFILDILLILLGIFIWFIKQPYIIAYITMLLITGCASALRQKSFKVLLAKFSILLISIVTILFSISLWDKSLVTLESSSSSSAEEGYMNGVFGGAKFYFKGVSKKDFCDIDYINNINLSSKQKESIEGFISVHPNNWCDYVILYQITKNNEIQGYDLYIDQDERISMNDYIYILIRNLIKHPFYMLGSYYHNYMALINVEGNSNYMSNGKLTSWNYDGFEFAKQWDGLYTFNNNVSTLAYIDMHDIPYEADPIVNYNNSTGNNKILSPILLANYRIIINLFKLLMFLNLPILLYSLVKFIKTKHINYFMICMISGATFANNLFQVIMGMIIDRYAYPLFLPMILCFLIILILIIKKFQRGDKVENRSEK